MAHNTLARPASAGRTGPAAGPVLWLVRHGGESLRDLYRRVADFADDLAAPGVPGEVAVVAHGGTLRVLTAYLRGVPVERMSWEPVANGSVVRLTSQPDRLFTRKEYR